MDAFDEGNLEKLRATNECVGCDLTAAKLIEADLNGANLTGPIFCETKMPNRTINNSGCE